MVMPWICPTPDPIKLRIHWMSQKVKQSNKVLPLGHYGKILAGRNAVTVGPFKESKEAIAVLFLTRADRLEQAVEVAGACPSLEFGQTVEVKAMVSEPYEL
jgi:hypothetical protein